MKEFEEKDAVRAMRAALSADTSANIPDDELLNILDIIWDWYDENGMLDIDAADDDDVDEEAEIAELVKYVKKVLAKDKETPVKPDDVEALVRAEQAYELSLID